MAEQSLIVTCPKCETRLRLKQASRLPVRFKVRCSSCEEPFIVKRRVEPELEQTVDMGAGAGRTVVGQATRSKPEEKRDPDRSTPGSGSGGPFVEGSARTFEEGERVAGRYVIRRFIARGGMGEVYEAEDTALGQRVALKTIRPDVASDQLALERFKREINVARQVTHHNVCRIHDLGTHQSRAPVAAFYPNREILFVTMELLEGETLTDRLRREGALDLDEALELAEQMGSALDAAHAAGIVHRDFKSPNVFLEKKGRGKPRLVVTDFGLARSGSETEGFAATLTVAGAVVGSPAYMSPEQVEGAKVTSAADIYAFGVVLYEMVTGRVPFKGDTPLSTAVKRLTENPLAPSELRLDLEDPWERVILKCLERSPASRFSSAGRAMDALTGRDQAPPERAISPRRMITAVVAGFLLAAAIGMNVWTWSQREAQEAEVTYLQPPAVARTAVAIMGFRNVTGSEQMAWLSTGLSEMLSSELAGGGAVRLIPGENVARSKRELGLDEGDTFAQETLAVLRSNLGSDYVVSGSYTAMEGNDAPQIRLDLRLQDTVSESNATSFAVSGGVGEIFELVEQAGEQLRRALGLDDNAEEVGSFRMASAEVARLYSEGLSLLHGHDALGARERLEEAAAADPRNPRVHSALAEALSALGYGERARAEAKLAVELSSHLGAAERSEIQGQYLETLGDWTKATEVYDQLFRSAPDNLEYGLLLARALTAAGQPDQALQVTAVLERLPSAASGDVRILFARARASGALGNFRQQEEAAGRAAEASLQQGARLLRAQALLLHGWALRNLGNPDQAQGLTAEAEGLYQQAGDLSGVARARVQRGSLLFDQGELDTAKRVFEQGVETYRELGDKGNEAQALNNLAVVLKRQGETDRARELYEASLALSNETRNRIGVANAENNIGAIDLLHGDLSGAEGRFAHALELAQEVGDRSQQAYSLYNLAVVLRKKGELSAAELRHHEALELRRAMGQRLGEAASLSDLGTVALMRGRPDEAQALFEESFQVADETGNRSLAAYAVFGLAQVHAERGEWEEAVQRHREALEIRDELGETRTAAESRLALSRIDLDRGNFREAESGARQAEASLAQAGALDLEAWAGSVRAKALVFLGRQREAEQIANRAVDRTASSQDLAVRLDIELAAARVAAAGRGGESAADGLQSVIDRARSAGLLPLRLEAQLVAAQLAAARGNEQGALESLSEVQSLAGQAGLRRLARRAEELTGAR